MKAVEIAGERFLVGLEWFIVGKKEVKQFLKEKKPKWYVKIARGEYVNIGMVPEDSEVDAEILKLPLLAPSLAETQESPLAGVFELSDKEFYHLAVGEGHLILPGGEVVGSKDVCQSAYYQNLEMFEEWKSVGSDYSSEDIYNLLLHSEKRYYLGTSPLEKLRKAGGKKLVVGVVALLLVAWTGFYLMRNKGAQKTTTKLNPSVIQKAFTQVKTKKETSEVVGFDPRALVEECYRIFFRSASRNIGWSVNRVLCSHGSAYVEMGRDTGAKVAYVSDRMEISSLLAKETYPINLKPVTVVSGGNEETEKKLLEWANRYSDVNFTPPYSTIEEGEDVVVKKRVFEAGGNDPVALGELAKIKDIVFTEMEITPSGWRVKGAIKGLPPPLAPPPPLPSPVAPPVKGGPTPTEGGKKVGG